VSAAAATTKPLDNRKKAAILMVLLGEEGARKICAGLSASALRVLAQEIAELGPIPPETAAEVLQEYQQMSHGPVSVARGGPDFAAHFFSKTLGPENSRPLVDKVRSLEAIGRNFASIQKAQPQELAAALEAEHPQTAALVLAHLPVAVAKNVLLLLNDVLRVQVVKRLAEMQSFSPEVVEQVSSILQGRLVRQGGEEPEQSSRGGLEATAALLNRAGPQVTKDLLGELEKENAELAASIRNQMFTFEDFAQVPEAGLRELLSQVDKRVLATAFKTSSEAVRKHFFKCMSSRAVEMLQEDIESLGNVRAKDIKQAQLDIVAAARKLEADGKLTLRNQSEEADA
jgi:flagellar motor switch protein FliG